MGKGSSGKARRGGAGIPSTPGISENERAAAGMERIEQERYDQVKKMFENELGFKNAANLAYAVRKGEVKYGACIRGYAPSFAYGARYIGRIYKGIYSQSHMRKHHPSDGRYPMRYNRINR